MSQEQGEPIPRPPHPLATHALVDSAVAFLAILVLGLIFGVSIVVILAIALVAGFCLAPYTHRTEVRQLAERAEAQHAADEEDGPP